jgi:Ras-related protein Rab-11A
VGNKSDLGGREVPTELAIQYAEQKNLGFLETSALNNSNIELLFNRLSKGKFILL